MTLTTYRFAPASRFPRHSHPQEQVVVVQDGSITFAARNQAVTVRPGQVLIIAPDVPHEAAAGNRGAVVWSVVSPARRSTGDYTLEE